MTVEDLIAALDKLDPKMVVAVPTGMQFKPVASVEVAQARLDKLHGYLTKMHPGHCSSANMPRMAFICPE